MLRNAHSVISEIALTPPSGQNVHLANADQCKARLTKLVPVKDSVGKAIHRARVVDVIATDDTAWYSLNACCTIMSRQPMGGGKLE